MLRSSLTHPSEPENREWERYEAQHEVSLSLTCGEKQHLCQVRDISLGGARLICPEELPQGQAIVVDHPEIGAVAAERRWGNEQEIGVTFDFSDNALALVSHCLSAMLDLSSSSPGANGRAVAAS